MTNNNWSDPARPGVPMNPEQSGWHCIQEPGEDPEFAFWRSKPFLGECRGCWEMKGTEDDFEPHEISNWRYLRPCSLDDPTPAEVDARVKDARRVALEEAARRLEELHHQHKYNPETGEGSEHDTGYYRALSEGAAAIRALKGEGDD